MFSCVIFFSIWRKFSKKVPAADLIASQSKLESFYKSVPKWDVIRRDGVFFDSNAEEKLLSKNIEIKPTVFIGCISYKENQESPEGISRKTDNLNELVSRRVQAQHFTNLNTQDIIKEYYEVYKNKLESESFEDLNINKTKNLAGFISNQLETITVAVEHARTELNDKS